VLLSLGAVTRRRDFIKVIAVAAGGWPLAARAEQPVIGFLNEGLSDAFGNRLEAFNKRFRSSVGAKGAIYGSISAGERMTSTANADMRLNW
jgi:hypothetical protein